MKVMEDILDGLQLFGSFLHFCQKQFFYDSTFAIWKCYVTNTLLNSALLYTRCH